MSAYSTYTDSELVPFLIAGDQKAFATLYDRHWAKVYYQVYRVLRDEEESKDVVQEVFSSLWLHRERLAGDTNIGAYLYVQGRNRVLNLIAKQKVKGDYLASIAQFMGDVSNHTVALLEEKELYALLEQEIRQLPPRMREIFEMSRKEDLSHREIAEKLGLSEQTVKKQVHNALKIIKPKLQSIGGITILLFFR